jgi:hypothetical protein
VTSPIAPEERKPGAFAIRQSRLASFVTTCAGPSDARDVKSQRPFASTLVCNKLTTTILVLTRSNLELDADPALPLRHCSRNARAAQPHPRPCIPDECESSEDLASQLADREGSR